MTESKGTNRFLNIGGTIIHLPGEVLDVLTTDDKTLVIFRNSNAESEDGERNLRAYANDGRFLWKAQMIPRGSEFNFYMQFRGLSEGKVKVDTWREIEFLVDLENGDLYRSDGVPIPKG